MHVVQLGPFPPPHGGVQTNLVAIRELLRQSGHRCSVINLNASRRANQDDVYYPSSGLELLTLLARHRSDIIHLHLGGNLFPRLLALAIVCAMWPGRRAVLSFHSGGYASGGGRTAGYWTLRGFVFRQFDHIITVNNQLIDVFRRFGVSSERLSLIPPFSSGTMRIAAEPLAEVEAFFAVHDPVLTTVGLLEPEYNLANLIDTLGELLPQFPGIGLIIIGSGSLDEDLRTKIQGSVSRNHVLLFGDMPHAQTLHTIARSRALIRATQYDGDSVAVRESLQLGTPVVATDNGMRPAGVRICRPGDWVALRELIREVLGTPPVGPPSALGASDVHETGVEQVLGIYERVSGRPVFSIKNRPVSRGGV